MKNALLFLGIVGAGLYFASHLGARRNAKQSQGFDGDLLDLNHCGLDAIAGFHGLGSELAERIIENRPYATKIDLIGRRIIPDATYELIKHEITVRNAA